jgi:hypothetical protein
MDQYGSQVAPEPPVQDMYAVDTIAGSVHDRAASPAQATGDTGGGGLGGTAEPAPLGGDRYDRIGY